MIRSPNFAWLGLEHELLPSRVRPLSEAAVKSTDPAHTAVLLEDTQRSVKVIAEGYGVLAEAMDKIKAKVEQHDGELDKLSFRISVHDKKIEAHDTELEELKARHEELSSDTRRRLDLIEAHLGSGEPPRPRPRPQRGSPKRRKAA